MAPHLAGECSDGRLTHGGRIQVLWLAPILLAGSTWVTGCAAPAPVSGLRPEYPEARYKLLDWVPAFAEVDSVQPTLRWESFPRPQDYEADKEGLLGRIRSVTYDLKIWAAENDYPTEEAYSRRGIPEPDHKLEEPLELSTKYFWTVRARFEVNGRPRVTEWGMMLHGRLATAARNLPLVPNPLYYRFKTPSK